jgi:hypothetical protein
MAQMHAIEISNGQSARAEITPRGFKREEDTAVHARADQ